MYFLPTDEFESFESWYKSRCYFAQVSRGYFALKKYLWEQVYQQQSKTYHLCKLTFSSHDKWQFCKTEMHRIRNIGLSETKEILHLCSQWRITYSLSSTHLEGSLEPSRNQVEFNSLVHSLLIILSFAVQARTEMLLAGKWHKGTSSIFSIDSCEESKKLPFVPALVSAHLAFRNWLWVGYPELPCPHYTIGNS